MWVLCWGEGEREGKGGGEREYEYGRGSEINTVRVRCKSLAPEPSFMIASASGNEVDIDFLAKSLGNLMALFILSHQQSLKYGHIKLRPWSPTQACQRWRS